MTKTNVRLHDLVYLTFKYLELNGLLLPEHSKQILFPSTTNDDFILTKVNRFSGVNAKFYPFNVFPISLATLKQENRSSPNKYFGVTGAITKPPLKIELIFNKSISSMNKMYLHILEVGTKKITFSSGIEDQSVEIDNYVLFR